MKQRCRCCLITNSNAYYDIFKNNISGTTYAENIIYLAEVQIDHNDGLPQQICSNCYDEVQRIYEFVLNVRLADEKLKKELEFTGNQIKDEDRMENVQVLENKYLAPVDENMQVYVIEEILEKNTKQENVLIAEETHDVDEKNMVEDIVDIAKDLQTKPNNQKESLLVGLAQVAATQENLNITDNQSADGNVYFPEDEKDEGYLIEFDPYEINNFVPSKWKCGECKMILRGDVSYEGHMNIHRQLRPHKCVQCQTKYRCRTALRRHKEFSHSLSIKNASNKTHLCMNCNKNFYSKHIFYLHQAIVHDQGDKCPFKCGDANVNNLKEHIENLHQNELNNIAHEATTTYQCFRCCKTFEIISLFECHAKTCQSMYKPQLQDNMILENLNSIKVEETADISVQSNICPNKLLTKSFNKYIEQHKRNEREEEKKVVDDTKLYLCSFCPSDFKNIKSLRHHEKVQHAGNSDIVYECSDCERQYASEFLLERHRKHSHKERHIVCNICGNTFKLKNQLLNHMKLHLEKNIPCPHCDKKYARQFDLNVHLRSHTGEQPYACHLCDKRFAIKVRLTYHLQKHYGIKHHCKECGAEFNSKQQLKAHSFKHTGMPYRCQLCDNHGFAARDTFKRHLTRVHHASISDEALKEMFQKNTGKNVNIKQINETVLCGTTSFYINELV